MAIITYIEAIAKGMWEEMERDPSVFLMGEDIGPFGGAFKATKGFLQHFGENRVVDTVLAETAILGAATGAAVVGMRPIAEMQFADFVTTGFSQLVNNSASVHYRWHIPCPMVVRLPSGAGIHGGPFHSRNPEAWFFHQPGFKIVAPSTPYDAKGLMKAAVRDNNPVLYLEHKRLYRHIKGEVPETDYIVEIGKGDVKREGNDISVITYGSMVHMALEAAEVMQNEHGVSVEVVDLRSLMPLDTELIYSSVRKTGKVLIAHEDNITGGIGGELSALITEHCFQNLDAPVKRIGAIDTPTPYSPTLEEFFLPNTKKVVTALQGLAAF